MSSCNICACGRPKDCDEICCGQCVCEECYSEKEKEDMKNNGRD
jgi:hypothetical protein